MTVTLYSLLFEQAASYDQNTLALISNKTPAGMAFVLYDTAKLRALSPAEHNSSAVAHWLPVVAAWMKVRAPDETTFGPCSKAWNIAYEARNPDYPGSGKLLTGLASAFLKAPITSDREMSNSDGARAKWARIEKDPDFSKVPLDNFVRWNYDGESEVPVYVHHDGTKLVQNNDRGEPRTPDDPTDDCLQPGKTVTDANDVWGTDDAFMGTGFDPKPFLDRHAESVAYAKQNLGISAKDMNFMLLKAGSAWFNMVY